MRASLRQPFQPKHTRRLSHHICDHRAREPAHRIPHRSAARRAEAFARPASTPRPRSAARRRQDDAGAARTARRVVARCAQDPDARTTPHRRARSRRVHGIAARRGRRRDDRLPHPLRKPRVGGNAHRSRHRRHPDAHDPGRSGARRRRRDPVRRIPRASSQRRSWRRARARRAGKPAPRPAPRDHVRDAAGRAHRTLVRRAAPFERRTQLPGAHRASACARQRRSDAAPPQRRRCARRNGRRRARLPSRQTRNRTSARDARTNSRLRAPLPPGEGLG